MKKYFKYIIIAFAISILGMSALAIYSVRQFSNLTAYSKQVDKTNQSIAELHKLENYVLDIDRKERGYMLTKDSAYLNGLFSEAKSLIDTTKSLKEVIDSQQRKTLILLRSALALRVDAVRNNLRVLANNEDATAPSAYYYEGQKLTNESIAYMAEMQHREYELLEEYTNTKRAYEENTAKFITSLLIIFSVVTIILFIWMIKELKKRLEYQQELLTSMGELKRSHEELEQIAYATSHHMQEPLRKIRVFADRLANMGTEKLAEEKDIPARMALAAERMQLLIEDISHLTSLTKAEGEKITTDISRVFADVKAEYAKQLKDLNGEVYTEPLPTICAYPEQLHLLFKSLLDNSIKYRRQGEPLRVYLKYDKANDEELTHLESNLKGRPYHRIAFSDNGIGFDNKYAEKMFQIFQRLHGQESEYIGKGIGLALSQRIMVNHGGYILAYGHPDTGATFKLYFPIEE